MPQWISDHTLLIFHSFHFIYYLAIRIAISDIDKKSLEKKRNIICTAYLKWPNLFTIRQHSITQCSIFHMRKLPMFSQAVRLIYVSAQFTFIAQYQLISAFIINERTNKHKKTITLIRLSSLHTNNDDHYNIECVCTFTNQLLKFIVFVDGRSIQLFITCLSRLANLREKIFREQFRLMIAPFHLKLLNWVKMSKKIVQIVFYTVDSECDPRQSHFRNKLN